MSEHRRYDSDEFDYSGCVVCDANGDTLGWPCPTALSDPSGSDSGRPVDAGTPLARDDAREHEIEFGSTVWSRSMQDGLGFIGGTVIKIDRDARTVDVVYRCSPRQGPDVRTLAIDELDLSMMEHYTRNPGIVAGNLFAWLGNAKGADRTRRNAEWGALAVQLQSVRDGGSLTPDAESRYQSYQAEQRERRSR